jgi:hypothetical protein
MYHENTNFRAYNVERIFVMDPIFYMPIGAAEQSLALLSLACAMLPLPVMDTKLATGEGRKKVCPDLAIPELSKRSMQSVSAWRPFRSLVRSLCYLWLC